MTKLNGCQEKTTFDGIEYTVSLIVTADNYGLYLEKPGYPLTFMFGLPKWQQSLSYAMELGIGNVPVYTDLFDDN